MMTPIEAAIAINAVSNTDTGVFFELPRLHKLLYYAQGLHLATTGRPMLEGSFVAGSSGPMLPELEEAAKSNSLARWQALRPSGLPQIPEETLKHLRDVVSVFGGWTDGQIAAAVRSERPWIDAMGDAPYGQASMQKIMDDDLLAYFEEMTEAGEDAMDGLGVSADADRPWWVKPYFLSVDLKRLAGHPAFDDAKSRELRVRLGYHEVPGSVVEMEEKAASVMAAG